MPDPTKEQFDAAAQKVLQTAPAGLSREDFFALIDKELAPPSSPMQEWWKAHPSTAQLVKGTLNTLPMAGGMTGAIVATPETFGAGTVVGGALGTGAGRGARDLLAESLGLESPTTPLSKASRIALDTAISVVVPAAAGVAKRVLTQPKTTAADFLQTVLHPIDAADEVIKYLRIGGPKIPPVMSNFPPATEVPSGMVPQTTPTQFYPSQPASMPFRTPLSMPAEFQPVTAPVAARPPAVNPMTSPVRQTELLTKFGGTQDPAAALASRLGTPSDIDVARSLIARGVSPTEAVVRASGGDANRFAKIMTAIMQSRQVK